MQHLILHVPFPRFHFLTLVPSCDFTTNIQLKGSGRSQTSYTTLCNGASLAMGAQIEGIRVFADHTRGNKHKQNASKIFARRATFLACLSSRSDRSTYAPDESRLFWTREKPWLPQSEPLAGIKMAQVLESILGSILTSLTTAAKKSHPLSNFN